MENDSDPTLPVDAFQPSPLPSSAGDGDAQPSPSRKRRRRKKLFPEMVPSHALRVLRHHSSSRSVPSIVYNEEVMDELFHSQIGDDDLPSASSSCRSRRVSSSSSSRLARELDVEALIASAVGFPIDSLIEEEIESNVISVLGGAAQ
ncbi:hypothetical protein HPP92_013103 [Vanilla planifolia]|uniref:Uncharacterized protein n=1 Tax=Vanilla planifolia TaxID=51239 RepID=A0A835QYR6_VANPL|nr:hypothetical protein HPP92_013103 [Vanilla planifolia]